LREKQKQIEALSDAKMDFMNLVMHEARSPLTSVLGYTDLIAGQKFGPVTDRQIEPLSIIKRQSQRILNLINDLLTLARIESGKTKFEKKPANILDVAANALEEMAPMINEKKILLVQEFDFKTPPVSMDEDKITEVFINLLSNAVKFSNEDGKIFLTISPSGKEVTVSVRDEGLGIDPADLPHIFEKFYRAGKESSERKGTGLGLALCKSIVESHGGRLWAVSAGHGKGAVFYFTLPL